MTSQRPERDPHPRADSTEEPGDDRLVGRGFRYSLLAVLALAAIVTAFLLLRPRPTVTPGSSAPVAPPAPSPATALGPVEGVPFRDVARDAGVDFVHESGARGAKLLPECLGGGVAIVDLDSDGKLDLVFTQGEALEAAEQTSAGAPAPRGGVRIYRNTTEPSGPLRFARVVGDERLLAGYAMGIAAGDVNGDGTPDLLVTCVGQDVLLLNRTEHGGDVRLERGAWPTEKEWGTSAGFLDVDADGDLDAVVANYVVWSPAIDRSVNFTLDGIGRAYGPPTGFEGTNVALFVNDGAGSFRDVTAASGVAVRNPITKEPYAKALGLVFVDADRDGRTDILVANDKTPKFLLRNLGPSADGTPSFRDTAVETGFAFDRDGAATGAMGIDAAYPFNDDRLSVAVGNFANEPSSLYLGSGDAGARSAPSFADEALGQGFGAPTRRVLTFGLLFADVDLDGDVDLLQANGHLEPDIARVQPSQTYRQRGQLFINRGGGAPLYAEAPAASIGDLAEPAVGRALASGDLDGDGDEDLVLVDLSGRARLLRNDQSTGYHWIAVKIEAGARGGRVFGTEIEVDAEIGGKLVTQRRILSPTRSYLSQCEPIARFGLGDATSTREIRVRAADGTRAVVRDARADMVLSVVLIAREEGAKEETPKE